MRSQPPLLTANATSSSAGCGAMATLSGHRWRRNWSNLDHPLAGVGGATNAMTITTDTLGDVTIVGPGAGRRETGFSLLNDLIAISDERADDEDAAWPASGSTATRPSTSAIPSTTL